MVLHRRKSQASGSLDAEEQSLRIEKKIYGAWLGKLIGIRCGAPIENWSREDILKTFGSIHGYPVDYDVFAADDDSNGPLYFVRAMLEYPLGDMSEKQLGDHLLNVICDGTGFFWWGGVGVSTEHTAYANLKKGIPAPMSGSAEQNGEILSQQIGGQIFSDCWGYISVGDEKQAADLAEKMSRVTHDMDAVQGGIFVAACIAAAWNCTDMKKIIRHGLRQVDPSSQYAGIVNMVLDMHEKDPEHPEICLNRILKEYGYDRYGGACPIWTNAAILVYSLLYGNGSFDRIMCLGAEAGQDTDCNMGNAGSIAGMAYGIEGINVSWIEPIHDTLLGSGSLGSLNETTITDSTKLFTRIACRLHGIPLARSLREDPKYICSDFSLPYGVWGFRTQCSRYAETSLQAQDAKLKLIILHGYRNASAVIRKVICHTPDEVYDCRYQPQFAASLFAGQTLTFHIANPEKLKVRYRILLETVNGKIIKGPETESLTVSFQIPFSVQEPVRAYSLSVRFLTDVKKSFLWIQSFTINRRIHAELDFRKWKMEDRGLEYSGSRFMTMQGLVKVSGRAWLDQNGLCLNKAMVDFGDMDQAYQSVSWKFLYTGKENVQFLFGMRGNRRYQAVSLRGNSCFYAENMDENRAEIPLNLTLKNMKKGHWILLTMNMQYDRITLVFRQGKRMVQAVLEKASCRTGLLGIENKGRHVFILNRCKLENAQQDPM